MTEREIKRVLDAKNSARPSSQPRYKRKIKLKMRYGKKLDILQNEITRTVEKLELLLQLESELFDALP